MDKDMLNTLFIESLNSAAEREKVAEEMSSYVRTRIRELSFMRQILQPEPVTRADCQRSVNHDQLVVVRDIEPDSWAGSINFRGRPQVEYVQGSRYEIPFFGVSSREFQKVEEELMSYEMPVTEVIENNSMKDLHAAEDESFIAKIEAAVTLTGKVNTTTTTVNSVAGQIDPELFVNLMNLLENSDNTATQGTHSYEARRYVTDMILMNRADYNKILLWSSNDSNGYGGFGVGQELIVNGYTYPTLMGKKIIVTQKGELVPAGTMYAFASREYLGEANILGDVRFFVEKTRNLISWSLYEVIGIGIGNAHAVAKVTWTN